MSIQQYNCPSCGAPLPQKFRYTRLLVCDYCKSTILLNADSLQCLQEKVLLTDYHSLIKLHSFFFWNQTKMEVIGRIRYQYDSGFWDEWLLLDTANSYEYWWLHEDEGDFTMFIENPEEMIENFYRYDELKVGAEVRINNTNLLNVFLCEKSEASVMGYEGEIPYPVRTGEKIYYVDGFCGGKIVSLEFIDKKCYVYIGTPLGITDVVNSIKKVHAP
jgi:DNA-directed RNA polymerase subunit RPC12/RpoP